MSTPAYTPIELTSTPAAEQEMVTLFILDGTEYKIPARPRMNLALKLLDDTEELGEALANMKLLKRLLGDDGYSALADHDGLSPDQLADVTQAAANFTLGALEESTSGN